MALVSKRFWDLSSKCIMTRWDFVIKEQTFNKTKFFNADFSFGVFKDCTFNGCVFEDSSGFRTKFINCTFNDCAFQNFLLNKPNFQNVTFFVCFAFKDGNLFKFLHTVKVK